MDDGSPTRAQRVAARKAHQEGNLFGRIQAAAMASRRQSQRLLERASNLTIPEWRILWDLSEAGPLSVQDMAQIQRSDHSLISRALPSMREKGYVTVANNTGDKRETLIGLTETGAAAFAAAAPTMQRRRAMLSQTLSPEGLEQIITLLDQFDAYLDTPIEDFIAQENPK